MELQNTPQQELITSSVPLCGYAIVESSVHCMFDSLLTTKASLPKGSTPQASPPKGSTRHAPPPKASRPQVSPPAKKVLPLRKSGYDSRTESSDSGHHSKPGLVFRRQLYSTAEACVQLALGLWTSATSAMSGLSTQSPNRRAQVVFMARKSSATRVLVLENALKRLNNSWSWRMRQRGSTTPGLGEPAL